MTPPATHEHTTQVACAAADPNARVHALGGLSDSMLMACAATLTVTLLANDPASGAVLGFLAFFSAAMLVRSEPWQLLLPFMRVPIRAVAPLLGMAAITVLQAVTTHPGLSWSDGIAIVAMTTIATLLPHTATPQSWTPRKRQVRLAVIGSQRHTDDLAHELTVAAVPNYSVAGRIEADPGGRTSAGSLPTLGSLDDIGSIVEAHDIRLLVLTGEVPSFHVLEEISDSCLHLPVRVWDLSGFYEDVFGHVPVAEINSRWFQYIMHPKYHTTAPRSKRAIDLALAVPLAIFSLPLLGLLSLLIKRDGGPAFFNQVRIGEGGKPLTVHKLRTMRVGAGDEAQWATDDDPRITGIGKLLRSAHLDELPQLINVIKGEMSLVGPRPEQPEFVDRLEDVIPFYQRRHLLKPGITGWAQVRCGYAGSDIGSAWKLSHDLYYLKHRSMAFDLAILAETLRTFFGNRPYGDTPGATFIYRVAPARRDEQHELSPSTIAS